MGNKNSFPSLGVACFYNFPLPDTSTPITRHQLMTLTLKWNSLITLVNYVVCFVSSERNVQHLYKQIVLNE